MIEFAFPDRDAGGVGIELEGTPVDVKVDFLLFLLVLLVERARVG
jgi:hypothetical protein